MFNSSPPDGYVDEIWSPVTSGAVAPASFESNIDCFDTYSDWNLYGVENVQRAQSFTSPPSQGRDFLRVNSESPTSSSDGTIASSLLRKGSFPGQEEKRKAQNRNSQRAFRKRQASYITTLESELKDLRAKYNHLLKCFLQIKEAVDVIGREVSDIKAEPQDNVAAGMRSSSGRRTSLPDLSIG